MLYKGITKRRRIYLAAALIPDDVLKCSSNCVGVYKVNVKASFTGSGDLLSRVQNVLESGQK